MPCLGVVIVFIKNKEHLSEYGFVNKYTIVEVVSIWQPNPEAAKEEILNGLIPVIPWKRCV